METKGEIYKLLPQIAGKIGAIAKDDVNQQQRFRYRGLEAVYNRLNPLLAEHGVTCVPRVVDRQREERHTRAGGSLIYSVLTVEYSFFAGDGSCVTACVVGEGMDSGDKASNKAMSAAHKYALCQVFCIAFDIVDGDVESPPESTQAKPAEKNGEELSPVDHALRDLRECWKRGDQSRSMAELRGVLKRYNDLVESISDDLQEDARIKDAKAATWAHLSKREVTLAGLESAATVPAKE